jgi:hypothetical protein
MKPFLPLLVLGIFGLGACVPKQQYDDQRAKLRQAEDKLKNVEAAALECDPNLFLQMKEQTQSLDLLSQELLERNTELSKEVARLKSFETEARTKDQSCTAQLEIQAKDHGDKAERLRRTYEDLVRELRLEIRRLEDVVAKQNAAAEASKAASRPKSPPKAASGKAQGEPSSPAVKPTPAGAEKKPAGASK